LLGAGLLGIEQGLRPPEPAKTGHPAEDDASLEKLPLSLPESLAAFENDTDIRALLGEEFAEAYLVMRRYELSRYDDWVTDWERQEYLEMF
jgi:glutamine synthetase